MYDANEAEYVCLSSNTPIVRYLELPRPPQPLTVTPPLRILGMTANPQDLAGLDVEREKQRVERALEDVQSTGAVELTWLAGQTAYDLQVEMWGGPWHIFHFIGHGGFDATTDEGLLALVDEDRRADYLSATDVGRLLAGHRSLGLVVLNSCEGAKGSKQDIFSSTAAILVRRGIPAVLAMQYDITDRAAITLSKVFYEALADGMPVDMAVSEARKTISLAAGTTVEWGTPVLYMRSPNGVLFDVTKKPSLQQEPAPPPPQINIEPVAGGGNTYPPTPRHLVFLRDHVFREDKSGIFAWVLLFVFQIALYSSIDFFNFPVPPYYFYIPLIQLITLLVLLLFGLVAKYLRCSNLREFAMELGMDWPASWRRTVITGIIVGGLFAFLFLPLTLSSSPYSQSFLSQFPYSPLFAFALMIGCGYVFNRVTDFFGRGRDVLPLILVSMLFFVAQYGNWNSLFDRDLVQSLLSSSLIGLIIAVLYLVTKRNLWLPVVSFTVVILIQSFIYILKHYLV